MFHQVASDPGLHRLRVRVTAPSRLRHSLFSDDNIRPTVPELIQRGVMSGLSLQSRWQFGLYLYSAQVSGDTATARSHPPLKLKPLLQSVSSYWSVRRINTVYAKRSVNNMLQNRSSNPCEIQIRIARIILPGFQPGASSHISSSLLPVIRTLKWKFLRDQVARMHRDVGGKHLTQDWLEKTVRSYPETERLRLAVCPDVRKLTMYFEQLSKQ